MLEGTAIVIDDDQFFSNLLTDVLEGLNLNVASYSSPEALFSELNTNDSSSLRCPEFILTDNQMPGMSGLEFLLQIKKMGCTLPDKRIAIISGRWDDIDMKKAKSLGCQVFDKYNATEKIQEWIKEAQKLP